MALASPPRVPGVTLAHVEPTLPSALPPLHVAAFVGFARRGPVGVPVRVDDPEELAAVLGDDGLIVDRDGSHVRPYLRRAAEAFFLNGGRRCWVVRVAGEAARPATFKLESVRRWRTGGRWSLRASSEGAWGNALRLEVSLSARAMAPGGVRRVGSGFALEATVRWRVGDAYRVTGDDEHAALFYVDRVGMGPMAPDRAPDADAPPVEGRWFGTPPSSVRRLELLTLDVAVRTSDGEGEDLGGLGLHPAHARYMPLVLEREARLVAPPPGWRSDGSGAPVSASGAPGRVPGPLLALRVPLDPGPNGSRIAPLPRVLEVVAPPGKEDAGEDDLDGFDPRLFMPEGVARLGAPGIQEMVASAREESHRLSLGGAPRRGRRLRGMIAALAVDEVGLLAVPDALHPRPARPEPPADVDPPPEPEPEAPESGEAPAAFVPCAAAPPAADGGEEAPSVAEEADVDAGEEAPPASAPSRDPQGFDLDAILSIQREAARLCQARGDMLACLAVPRGQDPAEWRERLLEPWEDGSYAALHHPWIRVRAETPDGVVVETVPPDGAACGVLARRELARGVWLAPANEPVRGAVGLDEDVSKERWADLFEVGVNLVRRHPDDFRLMSARTLSRDRHLSQINVRRLLQALRKALLRWGADFAFEPHDPALRRALKRRIEVVLEDIYRLGAFAGDAPETSFQVVVDDAVNPSPSVDSGRLVALVKVAPSWPMEFLEVRLIRTAHGLLDLTEA